MTVQNKEIPPMPEQVRAAGISEEQWRKVMSGPTSHNLREIAMALRISPKLLKPGTGEVESATGPGSNGSDNRALIPMPATHSPDGQFSTLTGLIPHPALSSGQGSGVESPEYARRLPF